MPHKTKWSLCIALFTIIFISGCGQNTASTNSSLATSGTGTNSNNDCWRYYDVADAKKVIPTQWIRALNNQEKTAGNIVSFCHLDLEAPGLSGSQSSDGLQIAVYQYKTSAEATSAMEKETQYIKRVPLTNTIGDSALWSLDSYDIEKQLDGTLHFRKGTYHVIVSHSHLGTPAKDGKYDFKGLVESAARTIESRL